MPRQTASSVRSLVWCMIGPFGDVPLFQNESYENECDLCENEPVGRTHSYTWTLFWHWGKRQLGNDLLWEVMGLHISHIKIQGLHLSSDVIILF